MKLITEMTDAIQFLAEEVNGKKEYYIQGIFMQGNVKNRNGRIYPIDILQKAVDVYYRQWIREDRAVGELGHPDGPQINYDRVSHKILSLTRQAENFIGRALVLDTEKGKLVKALIEGNVKFGVSSRGLGSLKNVNGVDQVQSDFTIATAADIVSDPSAPNAFVNGIMENVEWVWGNGIWQEKNLQHHKKRIDEAAKHGLFSEEFEEARIDAFEDLFKGFQNAK